MFGVRSVKKITAMQQLSRQWRRAGTPIALVPTMGYLHAGHLSLIDRARRVVGAQGQVVVSIFVNPTQFGPREDLARYPRAPRRDLTLCAKAGADVVFAPSARAVYHPDFSTWVSEEMLSQGMEGAARPTHFRGVTTIVAKLFNIVQPDVAVFGAKDFQQSAVVRRMVRDLNFPIKMIVAPTVREADGLAMSSRNKYLSASDRKQASVLWRAWQTARRQVRRKPAMASALKTELGRLIAREPAAKLDYIEFFDRQTLRPLRQIQKGAHMALAVRIGRTRLIDNGEL